MSNPFQIDRAVFIQDLLKAVFESLKQGQTVTTVVSTQGNYELEVTVTKLGGKRLPKTRRP